MISRDAVAPLRPRPCGPPLRGRATLRDGITTGRPEGLHEHGTGDSRFHLRNADPWSKIGGRRTGRSSERSLDARTTMALGPL